MDDVAGVLTAFVVGALISGLIGFAIGSSKDRSAEGFWLGALLGPIGWLIAALLPEKLRRRCQYCLKGVPEGATKCCHCGSTLTGTTQQQLADLQAEKQALVANKAAQAVPKAEQPPVIVRIPWEQLEKYVRCQCQVCSVNIEFPLRGEGQTVTCPKCGCETVLFNPHAEEAR